MKTLIIYYSKFGHTQMVAEAIARALQDTGTVRLISADKLHCADLELADLVIMGSPTHRMNLPEMVDAVLHTMPKDVLKGKPVAAYDTSYKMNAFLARMTAARRLDRKMRKLGGKRVVPPETFHVVDREGPLYEGELERAQAWGAQILERMNGRQIT